MYHPGQIVWSVEQQRPVKVGESINGKTRHFIDADGKAVCPKTIKEATILLTRGRIIQAPVPSHWCWSCDYWLDKTPLEKCEARDEHKRCKECGGFEIYSNSFGRVCQACYTKLEKDGLRLVTEELLKEINQGTTDNVYPSKVSRLISKLVELDDPTRCKRDSERREEIDQIFRAGRKFLKNKDKQ